MVEHTHTKVPTLKEQSEAYTIRQSINETRFRIDSLWSTFIRHHNSGYCAFEMQKVLDDINRNIEILDSLLSDLGRIEHYNYESVLALFHREHRKEVEA